MDLGLDLGWGSPIGVSFVLMSVAAILWAISKLVQASGRDDSKDD